MKRLGIFVALALLSIALPPTGRTQSSGLAEYERQSRETYKKQQKDAKRAAKQQQKQVRKANKKQAKAMKKYEKEQRCQTKK